MKELSMEDAGRFKGGTSPTQCAYQIASSAVLGSFFGGAGAIVGALAAATGPGCLSLW